MRKLFILLIFILVYISCDKNEYNSPVLVYSMKSDVPEIYLLNTKNEDVIVNFAYSYRKSDSLINLDFKYLKEKDILVMGLDTLNKIESVFKPKNMEFNMYQSNRNKDEVRTYVFNKEFGLFASLGFKSHQLFLKDSVNSLEKENIFKGLFIELNKTFIK